MKKILSSGLVIGAIISLVGCGGGSSTPDTIATGTSYYIDSAVSGVKYTCGSEEGTTGADGSFTFEVGSSCTFYLGDIELRSIDEELLVDGASVYERNETIARTLQSLDSDGNPENGITIDAAIIIALAAEGITSLPTTEEEMIAMLDIIEANGGTVVSEIDAQEHLMMSLFSSKTFYAVENWKITQWAFNTAVTELKLMGDSDFDFPFEVWIDGDKLYLAADNYFMVEEVTAEYALIGNYYQSEPATYTKLYFDEAQARAYLPSPTIPMTTEMLSGKTFYTDGGSDFERISFISSSEVIFREVLITQDGKIVVDTGITKHPYTITAFGDVVITFSDGGTNTYKLISTTDTQWNMVKDGDEKSPYSTWLLDAPTNFPDVDAATAALEDFVSGKEFTFYYGQIQPTFRATNVFGITISTTDGRTVSDPSGYTTVLSEEVLSCSNGATWSALSSNTISVGNCGLTFVFNGELVDGVSVTMTTPNTSLIGQLYFFGNVLVE